MVTRNYSIREDQEKRLQQHYADTGIRMSQAVRMAIDLYFIREDKKKEKDEKPASN